MIDVAELAKPLAGEKPAGENMEYDQSYLELEVIASGQGTAEGEVPNWKLLAKNCKALWEKTRDLRVAVCLTIAETAMGGVKELAAGLRVIHFLVQEMWDAGYPLLDPDDDNDPTERINILSMLSPEAGAMNDPVMFINRLRETRIVPELPYTIRDLCIANGEIEPLDGKTVDLNLIIGEIMGLPPAQAREQADYVTTAQETIGAVCKEANEKISGGNTVALASLSKEMDKLAKFFNSYFAVAEKMGEGAVAEDADAGEMPAGENASENMGEKATLKSAVSGLSVNIANYKPANRTDALLLLKKVIDYYQSMEPNSPIPLLLNRAMRMARMNFLELLENIVPEAAAHGKDILGDTETSGPQTQAGRPRFDSASASEIHSPAASVATARTNDSEPPHFPRIMRNPK